MTEHVRTSKDIMPFEFVQNLAFLDVTVTKNLKGLGYFGGRD